MTTQPTLFDASPAETLITILKQEVPARARRSDPQTSHDAAANWDNHKLTSVQMYVLSFFLKHKQGTDGQMETFVQETYPGQRFGASSLRKRRGDLVEKGIIHDTGEVATWNGSRMKVWSI